jgi:hypothetical protein
VAKNLNAILNHNLLPDNQYIVTNSNTLTNAVIKLKIKPNHRLLTLNIKGLYINIPISETIKITKNQLLKNNDIQITNQIITLLEIILNQNYFSFQGQIYQPDKVVAMGSPISGTMAEIFLQHLENTYVKHLIEANILCFYTRYVDDILVIYDSTLTTPDNELRYLSTIHNNTVQRYLITIHNNTVQRYLSTIHNNTVQRYLSTIHNNTQLRLTHEDNHGVRILDVKITIKPSHLNIGIYRKPTTDTTLNFLSNHPRTTPRRLAKYVTYCAQGEFPTKPNHRYKHRIKQKPTQTTPSTTSKHDAKWTTFTYTSPQIKKITNLFKHTNIKIVFSATTPLLNF